jgi:hypothetical protein
LSYDCLETCYQEHLSCYFFVLLEKLNFEIFWTKISTQEFWQAPPELLTLLESGDSFSTNKWASPSPCFPFNRLTFSVYSPSREILSSRYITLFGIWIRGIKLSPPLTHDKFSNNILYRAKKLSSEVFWFEPFNQILTILI